VVLGSVARLAAGLVQVPSGNPDERIVERRGQTIDDALRESRWRTTQRTNTRQRRNEVSDRAYLGGRTKGETPKVVLQSSRDYSDAS
jgi:hypothetical protein